MSGAHQYGDAAESVSKDGRAGAVPHGRRPAGVPDQGTEGEIERLKKREA
jgi:hypothetical protein